jgi:hypothetical protein
MEDQRLTELERRVEQLTRDRRRLTWRSRWAAVGAAIAVTLGGGTALRFALAAPGDIPASSFIPIAPTRILDTRPAPLNVGGFVGPLGTGQTHTFQVGGVAGVPSTATAVVMNVTVDKTSWPSFLTVFPAGSARPNASNLNWTGPTTIPNLVTVKLGANGQLSVFNLQGNAHVIADVAGYYAPSNDKFISLDVFGTDVAGATFSFGRADLSGLKFEDGNHYEESAFHFVLPPDYTPGGAIVASFTWHTAATSCNIRWRADYTSVSRAGQLHPLGLQASSGMTEPSPTTAGATANMVQAASFTLASPVSTFTLLPGDSYTFGLYRDGTDLLDTCAAPAYMDSMVIRYE